MEITVSIFYRVSLTYSSVTDTLNITIGFIVNIFFKLTPNVYVFLIYVDGQIQI